MLPEIIFEDNELLVVSKPAGLVVHEGRGHPEATLVDWLKHRWPKSPLAQERFGLLHRLDKDTSGLLLVAKTPAAFVYYKNLFRRHAILKEYLVLVHGRLTPNKGIIRIPLSRHLIHRTRFEPNPAGRFAETKYQTIRHYRDFTYLQAWPTTGRTHQLRVHFASIGHPIAGDRLYGKKDPAPRQFLHAHQLKFTDQHGHSRQFIAPIPSDLTKFLHGLT